MGPRMHVVSSVPDEDILVHVQGDGVGASAATGLPVGFGVAVSQLAGLVWVGGHLYSLTVPIFLYFLTGAWGKVG